MHPFAANLLWVLLATLPGCHPKECTEEPINDFETRIQITTNLAKFACHCIEPRGTVVKVLNKKIYHQEKVHSKFEEDALVLRAETSPKSCSLTWTNPDGERRNAPCKLREPQDQTLKSNVEQTAAEPEEFALERRSWVIPVILIVSVLILIGCAIIIMGNSGEILGAHPVRSPLPQIEEQEQLTTREDNGQESPEEDSTTTSWLGNPRETLGAHLARSPLPQIEEHEQLTTREDNGQEYSNPPEEESTTTSWLEKDTDPLEPMLRHYSLDSKVSEKYGKSGTRHQRLFSLDPTVLQKKKRTTRPLPDQTGDTSGRELSAGLSGAKKKVNPRQEQPSGETGPLKKVKSWQELQHSGERTALIQPIISEITEKTDENTDFDTNTQEPEETENSDTKKYRMKLTESKKKYQ